MITLSGIDRLFRGDEVETTALRDIDLYIEAGEFVAIMGSRGCGKSTLLNILGTIDRPTSGSYHFLPIMISPRYRKRRWQRSGATRSATSSRASTSLTS